MGASTFGMGLSVCLSVSLLSVFLLSVCGMETEVVGRALAVLGWRTASHAAHPTLDSPDALITHRVDPPLGPETEHG